jgi:hypothetical protein
LLAALTAGLGLLSLAIALVPAETLLSAASYRSQRKSLLWFIEHKSAFFAALGIAVGFGSALVVLARSRIDQFLEACAAKVGAWNAANPQVGRPLHPLLVVLILAAVLLHWPTLLHGGFRNDDFGFLSDARSCP